jgi:hypothetical protein
MKARVLVVLVAATLVAACGVTPTPSPATPAPSASPSSVVVAPSPSVSPSPSPSPTPLTAATIECAPTKFKTVFAGTLACDEAIAAALAALPQGHSPVLKAAFTYQLRCPLNTRCALTMRVDAGFVIITSKDGGLELVRVVKAANGTISTTGPEAYSPSA